MHTHVHTRIRTHTHMRVCAYYVFFYNCSSIIANDNEMSVKKIGEMPQRKIVKCFEQEQR